MVSLPTSVCGGRCLTLVGPSQRGLVSKQGEKDVREKEKEGGRVGKREGGRKRRDERHP